MLPVGFRGGSSVSPLWQLGSTQQVCGFSITSYSEIKRSWESHFCGALPMGIVVTGWSIMLQTYLFVLLYIIKKPSESKWKCSVRSKDRSWEYSVMCGEFSVSEFCPRYRPRFQSLRIPYKREFTCFDFGFFFFLPGEWRCLVLLLLYHAHLDSNVQSLSDLEIFNWRHRAFEKYYVHRLLYMIIMESFYFFKAFCARL